MMIHTFTYVACACGHRGSIVQTYDPTSPDGWYHVWLRDLSGNGTYEGGDTLFAEAKPACPKCGKSLTPLDVVGRSELNEAAEIMYPRR
ncbi:hypothetical protein [Paraburkholderia sp. RL17-373-BIF-A]|uniref:hypothetical protein n=1 Tax=Paraburkholderia sp. RL17-373-BIF-A TaxID=3031629 RepID=UPI0038BA2013